MIVDDQPTLQAVLPGAARLSDTTCDQCGATLAPDLHVMLAIKPIDRMSVGAQRASLSALS
jgi:hypothetical protein